MIRTIVFVVVGALLSGLLSAWSLYMLGYTPNLIHLLGTVVEYSAIVFAIGIAVLIAIWLDRALSLE